MVPWGYQANNLTTAPISALTAQSCCIDFALQDAERKTEMKFVCNLNPSRLHVHWEGHAFKSLSAFKSRVRTHLFRVVYET